MRKSRLMGVVALLVGAVVAADAQPPQRQRTPGGFGGGGPVALLKNKSVAEDIKLGDDQVEKLKTWSKDHQEKSQESVKAKFAEMKDLSREERAAKFQALTAAANAETYKQLGDILNPAQIKRVKEIDVQAAGTRAFSNPEVAAALKLTDEEKEKIKTVGDDIRKDLFAGGGGRPDPAKMEKARKEGMEKIMAVLTDDQKAAWKALVGEPFDTSKLSLGNRGTRPGTTPRPKD